VSERFFFLDLVGRVGHDRQLELRAPVDSEEVRRLYPTCCDLLIPYRTDEVKATIEVVVENCSNHVPRPDLLGMVNLHKERIWRTYRSLAYEVDEDGRRLETHTEAGNTESPANEGSAG